MNCPLEDNDCPELTKGYSAGGRTVRRRSSGFLMGGLAESVVSRELFTGLDTSSDRFEIGPKIISIMMMISNMKKPTL